MKLDRDKFIQEFNDNWQEKAYVHPEKGGATSARAAYDEESGVTWVSVRDEVNDRHNTWGLTDAHFEEGHYSEYETEERLARWWARRLTRSGWMNGKSPEVP